MYCEESLMTQNDYINESEDMDVYIAHAFGRTFTFLYPNYLDGIDIICAARGKEEGTANFFVSSFGLCDEDCKTWDDAHGYHYVGDEDVEIASGVELFEDEDPKDMFIFFDKVDKETASIELLKEFD